MSIVMRCPECKLPLTIDESSAGLCALCGASLPPIPEPGGAPEAKRQPPTPVPSHAARRTFWASVALVMLIGAGVLIPDWSSLLGDPDEQMLSENPEPQEPVKPKYDKPPLLAKVKPKEPKEPATAETKKSDTVDPMTEKTVPKESEFVGPPVPEKKLPPVLEVAKKVEFVGPPVPQKKPPLRPVVKPLVMGKETRLDDPDGEFVVPPLIGKTVKFTGKIHRLTISDVSGRSTLDASELQAKEIIILRPLLNDSTVKLNAPNGVVEFRGMISGRMKLFVNAPNGSVTFKANGGTIINESKLTITARNVEFNDRIQGWNNHVLVTLTTGGRLKFKEVSSGSKLHYKKAHPNDPEADIFAGEVINQGELRKIN